MSDTVKDILKEYMRKVDIMKTITGLAILFIFGRLVWALINKELPDANREVVVHVLGIIEGAVMAIVTFYYGSSKGSVMKDEVIKNQAQKQP